MVLFQEHQLQRMKMKNKTNVFKELIEEAIGSDGGSSMFGGGGGGGGGSFGTNSQKGAKSWSHQSPASRSMTGGPTSDELTGIISAEEDEAHQAPKRKPFPLETIDDSLVSAFIMLGNAEVQMKNCLRYNAFINTKKDKQKTLEFLKDKVKAIRIMIQGISEELDRITLSN